MIALTARIAQLELELAALVAGRERELAALRVALAELGGPLVTLTTAKRHLRIVDTAHDDDVTQKLTAASATIRDYLKAGNDPAWTPGDDVVASTVPPWVEAAVLLLLAHLYEHRGDEFGQAQDNDDRVWAAIGNLCRRARDPALA